MSVHDEAGLQEVEVDQRALVNILSRYPGAFDVLRELIQNADDAEAHNIEVHFQTSEIEKSQLTGKFDASQLKVSKWIIKNDGSPFRKKDWERLGRIADGNDNSTKVGAFGVGFYSVLSKSDRPLVKSDGESLQFSRGGDGKLRKKLGTCPSDSWTSIDLELRDPESLPVLADLTRFLVSSVAFLANIHTISIYLENRRLLHIHRELKIPDEISIPLHLKPTTPLETLKVESIQRTVQRITIDTAEWAFDSTPTPPSSPIDTVDTLVERLGRSGEDYLSSTFRNADAILEGNAVTHDLYTATINVYLNPDSEMKKCVESSMKSLPDSFKCKVVYFNSEQYDFLSGIKDSQSHKAKRLSRLLFGSQGIAPENDRQVLPVHHLTGRLFIGQSTNQTTGIGLHISAHFLPTMERSSIDLANGQVAAWNMEVLHIGGFLARVIYEEEMRIAKSKGDLATRVGLSTMARFAFGPTSPHSGVSQILQDAFFSCSYMPKSPFPVVSSVVISCASDSQFRQSNKDLSFLKKYLVLHDDVEPRQRSQIISQYGIPLFRFGDIVREFTSGVTQDVMKLFFIWWWEDIKRNPRPTAKAKDAREKFCKEFASRGVLCPSDGVKIPLKNIKHFTFFPLPDDLSPPDNIYVDATPDGATRDAVERFGWTQLPLLYWLKCACSQARQPVLNADSSQSSDLRERISRVLVQFALVDDLSSSQWAEAANLMKDLECIRTNKGLKSPANSYFEEANVCGTLPVAAESTFLTISGTLVAVGRGFQYKIVDMKHIRNVLTRIGVHPEFDWEDMVGRLESVASEESNSRFLRYLAVTLKGRLMDQQMNDLKEKRVFFSKDHGRVSATALHLPSDDVRKLGLPILALPRSGITSLQNDVDSSGSFAVEPFVESLGIQKYPSLDNIILLATSDGSGSALQYFLSNLETHYRDYKPDKYAGSAFIPTIDRSLACPSEVLASSTWERLGFKQVSQNLLRDLSRLGIKDEPSVDTIVERFKTPEHTLPDIPNATIWFEHLYGCGLPMSKLREQLSAVPFVPVESPGSSSSEYPSIEYKCPQSCFITSGDVKEHYRVIFPFVDFGQDGNCFLHSCGAKKSPEASDIVRKILEDPQRYLEALQNDTNLYHEDLRTIASQLESISEDDKQAMRKAPMFPAQRKGRNELLRADQVVLSDWESRDFGDHVFVAVKDDILEKMYCEMGSVPLGTYVRHGITTGHKDERDPPFDRDRVIRRVRCFMDQRDKSRKTDVSFYDQGSTNSLRVKVCKTLTLKKVFAPPFGVLADVQAERTIETKPIKVKAGLEINDTNETYTLWMVRSDRPRLAKLCNDISEALCHILLKTYGANDVLLLSSLLAMDDERLVKYYGKETTELPRNPDAKEPRRLHFELMFPLFRLRPINVRFRPRRSWSIGQKATLPENDVQKAVESWGKLDPNSLPPDFSVPSRPHPNSSKKHSSHCKQAHTVKLEEIENLQDEKTQIKFFLTRDACRRELPPLVLEEFAELVSNLAHVFDREASQACYIFWKDTDEELMAFNWKQKYIFLNLAYYYRSCHIERAAKEQTITKWYLIMAHEIAHNVTLEHDEYHGSLSSRIAFNYFPALRQQFPCLTGINV